MKSNQLKKLSAAIGAGAVVAMGALAVFFFNDTATTETVISDPEMTLGETATSTTAPVEIETPVAVPPVTAEPPDGF